MNKGMMIGVGALVLLLVGGGIWFSTRTTTPETIEDAMEAVVPTGVMMKEETATDSGESVMEEEVVEIDVTNSGFKFNPATISVKKGQTVRVTYTSSAGANMLHDFVIDEFDVATSQLADGESETVEFIADQVGTFDFYCSVGNHRAMGMEGQLVVE